MDVTLVDAFGNELEMPSEFDDFSEKAHGNYLNASEAANAHREFLKEVMTKHGFKVAPTEWWHFNLNGWHDNVRVPPLAVPFEDLSSFQEEEVNFSF